MKYYELKCKSRAICTQMYGIEVVPSVVTFEDMLYTKRTKEVYLTKQI